MLGSLGIVTINGPVRITVNAPDQVQDALRLGAVKVRIQAAPGNAGVVTVGLDLDDSPQTLILGYIAKPANATTGPFDYFEIDLQDLPGGMNLYDIFVDGTTDDEVVVAYTSN